MNIFTEIKDIFEKIIHDEPSAEKTAQTVIAVAAALLGTIVEQTAGEADASEIASVVTEVQGDLTKVNTLITEGASASDINSVLSDVQTNLSGLLTAGHIKDTATLSKVTTIVDSVLAGVESMIALFPPAAASTVAAS